jgi:phage regulator Rha-like protein
MDSWKRFTKMQSRIELEQNRIYLVEQQVKIKVFYDETQVGFYLADLGVESSVIVDIKARRYPY